MNTRGDARHHRALDEDFFGIKLRTRGQTARFRQLKARPIKSTKWACPTMLNHLGIGQEFCELANAASLQHFIFQRKPTYRRLTLEFLSTLKHTLPNHPGSTEEGVDRVTFQLMGRSYDISFNEWCRHFRFLNSDNRLRSVHQGLTPSPRSYFHQMSKYSGTPKGGQIESPAIRYLYYVIANTLQAHGEFTKFNEEEMIILAKAAIPTCNVTPNLGAFLLFHLDRQAVQTRCAITCGGIITLLVERLLIDFNAL